MRRRSDRRDRLDQATVIKLPEKVATLVVGNPLIADVSLQPGGIMIVTGKGYGATNVMAMDRGGDPARPHDPGRGADREARHRVSRRQSRDPGAALPVCQQRITLGDGQDYFKSTIEQAGSRNSSAKAATGGKN